MKMSYLQKLNRLGLLVGLATFLVTSCQKSEAPKATTPAGISLLGSKEVMTRASETQFTEGDMVGAFIVRYADVSTPGALSATNFAANVKFTCDATGKFLPETLLEWYNVGELESPKSDFYAYYPYNSALDLSKLNEVSFNIQKNQSAYADYTASDFMWARVLDVTPEIGSVPMVFKHVMSRFVLNVKATTGSLDPAKLQVKFKQAKTYLTWDLANMQANNRDSIADIIPYQLPSPAAGYGVSFAVILPPQVITSELIEFIYDGGAPRTWTPFGSSATRFDLCYSKQYTLNVGLNL